MEKLTPPASGMAYKLFPCKKIDNHYAMPLQVLVQKYHPPRHTFEGYRRVYLCRKIYQCPFNKDGFVNSDDIINRYYKDEPFHNFYVGEIIKVYE